MGKNNSKSQSPGAASQFAYGSSSPPYSGSTAQSQSRNAGSSSYSSNIHIREDDPLISFLSTPANTSTGARPKQYRVTSSKKPLYMAGSLSSLCERIDRGIDWSDASSLAGKARNAMSTANKAYGEKDEEKAYVLYERYARMWAHIRESVDYRNTPISFHGILGQTDIQTAYDRIDELKLSLESRYPKLPVRSSLPTRTTQGQTLASVSRVTNSSDTGQRQTFQPLQPPQPAPRKVTSSSSSTRSTGSKPSQISSNTRSTGSTPSQTSANTRPAGSTPVQPLSTARSVGAKPPPAGKSTEDNQATRTGQQQQSSVAKKDAQAGIMKKVRADLDCPICLDLFKNAKNLPCGHIICEECIGQWVASKGGMLSCPTCKTVHCLPSNGVAGLAPNFVLNILVAEVKKLEEIESEEEDEEPPPTTSTTPPLVDMATPQPHLSGISPPTTPTIPSLVDMATPHPHSSGIPPPTTPTIPSLVDMEAPHTHLSGIPVAETSFLEKNTRKTFKDAKGSPIRMRVQLCDFEGTNVRGRSCNKVEATVTSPTNEKQNVSVSLMKIDGDYSLSFIPTKTGVHLVEAYLNNVPVGGSPLKVIVHPSAKFDNIIHTPMRGPLDVVVHGGMIYATDDSENAYLRTDWEGNWSYPTEDRFDEAVESYGIDASHNRLYVTVPNKSCVYVYDLFGGYKNTFGKRVLEYPTGIAVSRERMIYVADTELNTIEVFRPNFSHMNYMPAGGNADHCSLALLALNPAEDRLIAADKGSDCFKIFDVVNMKMIKMIKTRVQSAPAKPFGVAVDEDGNILVSVTFDPTWQKNPGGHNRRKGKSCTGAIIAYNSEGYFLGKFGDSELRKPNGLCIAKDKVVVVDEGARVHFCLQVCKL